MAQPPVMNKLQKSVALTNLTRVRSTVGQIFCFLFRQDKFTTLVPTAIICQLKISFQPSLAGRLRSQVLKQQYIFDI